MLRPPSAGVLPGFGVIEDRLGVVVLAGVAAIEELAEQLDGAGVVAGVVRGDRLRPDRRGAELNAVLADRQPRADSAHRHRPGGKQQRQSADGLGSNVHQPHIIPQASYNRRAQRRSRRPFPSSHIGTIPAPNVSECPEMSHTQMSHLSHPKKCDILRHSRHLEHPISTSTAHGLRPTAYQLLPKNGTAKSHLT